jgi:hypothetical protein
MKIAAVLAELHIFSDEVNWRHPLRLQIRFEDGTTLRLRISGNGEELLLDRLLLEPPMDMAEAGRTDSLDFTDRLDPALKHQALGEPLAIHNQRGMLVGLALPQSDGERFCVWINGDEFRWGPEAALEEDYWPDGWTPAVDGPFG